MSARDTSRSAPVRPRGFQNRQLPLQLSGFIFPYNPKHIKRLAVKHVPVYTYIYISKSTSSSTTSDWTRLHNALARLETCRIDTCDSRTGWSTLDSLKAREGAPFGMVFVAVLTKESMEEPNLVSEEYLHLHSLWKLGPGTEADDLGTVRLEWSLWNQWGASLGQGDP